MPLPAEPAPAGRRLLRDEAYERLREAIESGTLEAGETLRDADIAAWLGTSRMPVREALFRLSQAGLVEVAVNRYTRVAPLNPSRSAEAHAALALLEGELAARLAADAPDMDALESAAAELTWSLWRGDAAEALALERAFHARLRPAQPTLLSTLLDVSEPLARRAQLAAWPAVAAAWPTDSHVALIEALRRQDAEAARASIAEEWRRLAALVSAAPGAS